MVFVVFVVVVVVVTDCSDLRALNVDEHMLSRQLRDWHWMSREHLWPKGRATLQNSYGRHNGESRF